jgi:hypothetical protein
MTLHVYKRLTAMLVITVIGLLLALWRVAWCKAHVEWDARETRLAVKRIENLRSLAIRSDPKECAECLSGIAGSYSPKTWQRPDLRMQEIVEWCRTAAIHDVTAYLRAKTGKDVGESP